MGKSKIIIAIVAVLAAAGVGLLFFTRDDGPGPSTPAVNAAFARPMLWDDAQPNSVPGQFDPKATAITVGSVTIPAPQPIGSKLAWKATEGDGRIAFNAEGTLQDAELTASWTAGRGNPNTVFEASLKAKRAALTEEVVSRIELPPGELSYVDATLARVAFAGTPIVIGALTHGPIVWKSGDDALTLWQWRADRVRLSSRDDGGVSLEFVWWDPALHPIPQACSEQLGDLETTVEPRLTLTFGEIPDVSRGRLPSGGSSAVVPIFVDPVDFEDPKVSDAASASAEDYAARARTIALGHSSPTDARHGNGGLVGLDVGGTVVVPSVYTMDAFETLESDLGATSVELVPDAALRPKDCDAWAKALSSGAPLLGEPHIFDGKFPNLFAPTQQALVPSTAPGAPIWHLTQLTGRRKDVVTQALSSTYLSRLAMARGIAVLEIPLVATRNPLVAAAAEALLDPERGGNWTIQEDLARALGEVELLSESERFDFVSLTELTDYTLGAQDVEIDATGPSRWLVHNTGDALTGFTVVVDGVATATVDENAVETSSRRLPNDAVQTWIWWDLAEGATYELALTQVDPPTTQSVSWAIAIAAE